jgi:toxin ParE1/3/4
MTWLKHVTGTTLNAMGLGSGLGLEFLAAIEDVFDRIQATPELYAGEYKGIRRTVTKRFPYVVYYRLLVESVEVLAVLHGSRNSSHWRRRA